MKRFLVLRLCESTGFTEHGSSNKRGRGANAAGTHVLETCTQIAKIRSVNTYQTRAKNDFENHAFSSIQSPKVSGVAKGFMLDVGFRYKAL